MKIMFDHVQVFDIIQMNVILCFLSNLTGFHSIRRNKESFRTWQHFSLSDFTSWMVPKLQFYENKVATKEDGIDW